MKLYTEGTVKALLENKVYHTLKDCPATVIPDVHGPLKDADVMLEMLKKTCAPDDLTYTIALGYLEALIKHAPTVVEASCREEDK